MITEKPRMDKEDKLQNMMTLTYLTRLCTMVDNFSEKWSDKAQDPKRFVEVAQELRGLKKMIVRYASEKNILSYPPEQRVEKWMFEICMKDDASTLIQTSLGLPFSNKTPLKEQLERFVSMKPSEISDLQNKTFQENLKPEEIEAYEKILKNSQKNTIKPPKKSSMEEADEDASFREVELMTATEKKNRMLDYAIIVDALAGGADKSIEEQVKDFRFIVRNKGGRRSDYSI